MALLLEAATKSDVEGTAAIVCVVVILCCLRIGIWNDELLAEIKKLLENK